MGGSCLCEWILIWKSESLSQLCNVLFYNMFYGSPCNLCNNGSIKLSCIMCVHINACVCVCWGEGWGMSTVFTMSLQCYRQKTLS